MDFTRLPAGNFLYGEIHKKTYLLDYVFVIFYFCHEMKCENRVKRGLFLLGCLLAGVVASAQNSVYESYIERYKHMAVEQMAKYGVPASITLAQGLLESGAGQSTLATEANNHFGIKVGSGWRGPYVLRDDDAPNEKFRAYRSADESYEDHSRLLHKPRYSSLFRLKPTDYRGWAKGLKSAGYATNPRYADLLISLIERYDLDRFDRDLRGMKEKEVRRWISSVSGPDAAGTDKARWIVRRCNDVYYVIANAGDTYADIAEWADVSEKKLRRYNEVPENMPLHSGEIVYLGKKQRKASRSLKGQRHKVGVGESVHSISQLYGIRMETLYELNGLPANYVAAVGDCLLLR